MLAHKTSLFWPQQSDQMAVSFIGEQSDPAER